MDKYGLIGLTLGHSFSQSYFNEKFENEDINAVYINFEIPSIKVLPEVIAQNPELRGFNVTIPYKQQVMNFLDSITPEAKADRKSTRLNSSHANISYAVFCLKK